MSVEVCASLPIRSTMRVRAWSVQQLSRWEGLEPSGRRPGCWQFLPTSPGDLEFLKTTRQIPGEPAEHPVLRAFAWAAEGLPRAPAEYGDLFEVVSCLAVDPVVHAFMRRRPDVVRYRWLPNFVRRVERFTGARAATNLMAAMAAPPVRLSMPAAVPARSVSL